MPSGSQTTRFPASADGPSGLPKELANLLGGATVADREQAWEQFLQIHSTLLLQVARSVAPSHDGAMDHYAYVLGELRRDDYRRLKGYVPDGSTKFTTWLVVVARRLCVDHYRRVYGRPWKKRTTGEAEPTVAARRRLIDLLADDISLDSFPDTAAADPDRDLRLRQRNEMLARAMDTLSPRDQILLRLRFEDDIPIREIAALMRFPTVFRVYRRINTLLDRLRSTLANQGVDDSEP
jgi:RNA polymerase sigma factor (sigma-70 family)